MCDICCEKFTFHNKELKCQYCDFTACQSCHQTYVFGTNKEMHCMSCKKEWTDDFISDQFTKKFYNKDLKEHREKCIIEKEKVLLPGAQECLERYQEYKKALEFKKTLEEERSQMLNEHCKGEIISWYKYNQLRGRVEHWEERVRRFRERVVNPNVKEKESPKWTWACPDEECRGFMNEEFVCGTCNVTFCSHCHEKHEGKCDQNKKKSVQMLKKDSRPCPQCATVIHKIDGCDQMWCPDCHTAFSWEHGIIETKTIHNPHYYEFLRNTQGYVPRTPGDEVCQDDMPIFPQVIPEDDDLKEMYLCCFRVFAHGIHGISHRWNEDAVEELIGENTLKFMRIQYLAKDLTDQKWKKKLQMNYKAARKSRCITEVIMAMKQVGIELFWDTTTQPQDIVNRSFEALDYFNSVFKKISKKYNCIAPYFNIDDDGFIMCIPKNYQVEC